MTTIDSFKLIESSLVLKSAKANARSNLEQQDGVNLLKKRPYDGRTDTHMKTPNLGDFT
jgi:hypothetical protein